jgi:nitric oxide reductase subunit C
MVNRYVFLFLSALFILYSAIVYTTGTDNGTSVVDSKVAMGKQLFQEKNCIACHQIYGLGGHMGPDLTNVISDPTKGPNYAKAFLTAGSDKMPNFHFSEEEMSQLIAFLEFLGKDGVYPPKNPSITWYGTVEDKSENE